MSWWSSAQAAPISSPSARARGTGNASSNVTSRPFIRQVAATSEPMNPAPTTTTRAAAFVALADGEGVLERPEHVDARDVGRAREQARAAAGGDHQAVEADALPVVEHDGAPVEIELGGSPAEPHVERPATRTRRRDAGRSGRVPTRPRAPAWRAGGGRRGAGARRRRARAARRSRPGGASRPRAGPRAMRRPRRWCARLSPRRGRP